MRLCEQGYSIGFRQRNPSKKQERQAFYREAAERGPVVHLDLRAAAGEQKRSCG
jgi:hypothetical protein